MTDNQKRGLITFSIFAAGVVLLITSIIRVDSADNYRFWEWMIGVGSLLTVIGGIRLFIGGTRK